MSIKTYYLVRPKKSVDIIIESTQLIYYPVELLNSLNPSGFPPHILELEICIPNHYSLGSRSTEIVQLHNTFYDTLIGA